MSAVGGSPAPPLGSPRGAKHRTYYRLKHYLETVAGTLFEKKEYKIALEAIHGHHLRSAARDTLNKLLKTAIGDEEFVRQVADLHAEGKLVLLPDEEDDATAPHIICSLGLRKG